MKRGTRIVGVVSVALAVGGGVFAVASWLSPPAPATRVDGAQEPVAVFRVSPRSPAPVTNPHGSLASSDAGEAEPELTQPADLPEEQRATGPLHARWLKEPTDTSWAPAFEQGVNDLFDSPELHGSQLIEVDCRTTLCRIELSFDGKEAFERLLTILDQRAPLSGSSGISDVGRDHLVTYVTPPQLLAAQLAEPAAEPALQER